MGDVVVAVVFVNDDLLINKLQNTNGVKEFSDFLILLLLMLMLLLWLWMRY